MDTSQRGCPRAEAGRDSSRQRACWPLSVLRRKGFLDDRALASEGEPGDRFLSGKPARLVHFVIVVRDVAAHVSHPEKVDELVIPDTLAGLRRLIPILDFF